MFLLNVTLPLVETNMVTHRIFLLKTGAGYDLISINVWGTKTFRIGFSVARWFRPTPVLNAFLTKAHPLSVL